MCVSFVAGLVGDNMNVPTDWQSPKWVECDRVHNWRNYASEDLKLVWCSFTDEQKQIISECLQDCADREEWD